MKALVLCAGYAVRLQPLTLNKAKPLLSVAGKPIVDYVVEKIDGIEQVDKIYVVSNDRFFGDFREWAEHAPTAKEIVLVNDGSTQDDHRLGAIADMEFAIEAERIEDDLLVVGGDNLFDFGLGEFVSFFEETGTSVALRRCDDPKRVKELSIVELDAKGKVTSFVEKPEQPASDLVAICLYLFEKDSLPLLKHYLREGGNRDAPGHYIEWLHKQIPVYGKILEGLWYDIGDERTYREADRLYAARSELSRG